MVGLTKKELLEMMRRMLLIRHFEDRVWDGVNSGEVPGGTHTCHGEEAFMVGMQIALRESDYTTGTHRSHGHTLGRGVDPNMTYAEICGRSTGMCGGRGGSMHMADFATGSLGETSVVGSNIPVATGAAFHCKRVGNDSVSLTFFGDGAAGEGVLHESMNMASLWKLPVIYACENNGWYLATPTEVHTANVNGNIAEMAKGYNIPYVIVDGQDVIACYKAARDAIGRARNGLGPTFIEGKTFRYRPHSPGKVFDMIHENYDQYIAYTEKERDYWIEERDPIALFRNKLVANGIITEEEFMELRKETYETIENAREYALNSPMPNPEDVLKNIYCED